MTARRAARTKAPVEAEETPPPYWQALLTPIVAHAFGEIGISVSLWSSGDWWESIHRVQNGFAPDYFSRLFRRAEGITFERHLQRLRVSKAMRMLRGTDLGIDGVSTLSGFSNRGYFHRVFKAAAGMTPIEYRRRTDVRHSAV